MINKQVVDSLEALALDCIQCGVRKQVLLDYIVKTGNRCLDEELYEYMDTLKDTHNKIKAL